MDIKNKQNELPSNIGQSPKLDNGNNPKGVAGLKQARQTNVNDAGTAFLRGQQTGNNK